MPVITELSVDSSFASARQARSPRPSDGSTCSWASSSSPMHDDALSSLYRNPHPSRRPIYQQDTSNRPAFASSTPTSHNHPSHPVHQQHHSRQWRSPAKQQQQMVSNEDRNSAISDVSAASDPHRISSASANGSATRSLSPTRTPYPLRPRNHRPQQQSHQYRHQPQHLTSDQHVGSLPARNAPRAVSDMHDMLLTPRRCDLNICQPALPKSHQMASDLYHSAPVYNDGREYATDVEAPLPPIITDSDMFASYSGKEPFSSDIRSCSFKSQNEKNQKKLEKKYKRSPAGRLSSNTSAQLSNHPPSVHDHMCSPPSPHMFRRSGNQSPIPTLIQMPAISREAQDYLCQDEEAFQPPDKQYHHHHSHADAKSSDTTSSYDDDLDDDDDFNVVQLDRHHSPFVPPLKESVAQSDHVLVSKSSSPWSRTDSGKRLISSPVGFREAKCSSSATDPAKDGTLSRRWNSAMRMVSMHKEPSSPQPINMRGSIVEVAPPTITERLRMHGTPSVHRHRSNNATRGTLTPHGAVDLEYDTPVIPSAVPQRDDYVGYVGATPVSAAQPERRRPKSWLRSVLRRR